jgi:pullulanase/glycogen debranching enzyme
MRSNMTLFGGFIDGRKLITIRMNEKISDIPQISEIKILTNEDVVYSIAEISKSNDPNEILIKTETEIDIKKEYYALYNNIKKRLVMNKIYQDPKYYDLNAELGSIYKKKSTMFRLFAPRATAVKVNVYDNPVKIENELFKEYVLLEKKGGVWEITVKGDLSGKYYTYKIISVGADCNPELEIVDPYAKIITRGDGVSVIRKNEKQPFDQTLGRAMIIDLGRTEKVSSLLGNLKNIEDAIIWEVHTRDLTMGRESGIPANFKGLFPGVSYQGSKYKNYSTGFDHIIELGPTVVQLLPVSEFVLGNEKDFKNKFIEFDDQGVWPEKRYYDWGYGIHPIPTIFHGSMS